MIYMECFDEIMLWLNLLSLNFQEANLTESLILFKGKAFSLIYLTYCWRIFEQNTT